MKFGADGRLYAINPEDGFFGVAPGTSMQSNPNAMLTATRNSIFTNCALTPDGDVWWEGATPPNPSTLTDWLRPPLDPRLRPQSRPSQCPLHRSRGPVPRDRPRVGVPQGVPIVGDPLRRTPRQRRAPGHRSLRLAARHVPRRHHSTETTAAAAGKVGQLRRDPMAMLPFCGYHMGDYFAHWLKDGRAAGAQLPKIYYVNWFRRTTMAVSCGPAMARTAAC